MNFFSQDNLPEASPPHSLIHGDCLEVMKRIEAGSVGLVLTDPPYGTTQASWDSVIDLDRMWEALYFVIPDKRVIALFCSQPFTSVLISSNLRRFKYSWVWEKNVATGFLDCKWRPLSNTEDIAIFSTKGWPFYNPQMSVGAIHSRTMGGATVLYNDVKGKGSRHSALYHPKRLLKFDTVPKGVQERIHPTQKPVDLLEYFIKTYTDPGETVLDFTAGSMSTVIACLNTGRKYIAIEMDNVYLEKGIARVEKREREISALGISVENMRGISADGQISLFQWAGVQDGEEK